MNFDKTNWYYQLADGRCWSTAEAGFAPEAEALTWAEANGHTDGAGRPFIPASPVDEQGGHTLEGLRQGLLFYGLELGELAGPEGRRAEVLAELAAIDAERVRPLAELALDPGAEFPARKLAELEARAAALRGELAAGAFGALVAGEEKASTSGN